MATAKKKDEGTTEIQIMQLNQGELRFYVVGNEPLIYNAMSEKARHELLLPSPRKNAAERAANLKHNPLEEYRASVYLNLDAKPKSHLAFPSSAFKKAMASAALDIPGAAKSQIGRLCWVPGERVAIYGVPRIFSTIVRSADMNRTPDVRTRAILPEWAAVFTVRFMTPLLREQTVFNLMAAAGFTQGIGDWRQQKGAGSYGTFRCTSGDDADLVRIMKDGGRAAQAEALENPEAHDDETERLLAWFDDELKRRGARGNGKAAVEDEGDEATEN